MCVHSVSNEAIVVQVQSKGCERLELRKDVPVSSQLLGNFLSRITAITHPIVLFFEVNEMLYCVFYLTEPCGYIEYHGTYRVNSQRVESPP